MNTTYKLFKHGKNLEVETYRLWPLYGAGLENLGRDGRMISVPMSNCGDDELIIRHDACSLCFSDIKVIRAGQDHPRIYRDMKEDPVVLGHEVALTLIEVGNNLTDRFSPGDRFILQAEIYVDGINYAYGYELQGGLSEFNKIDMRIIDGDDGSYLIPVKPETGYAESALSEPWACVNAAYSLNYRTSLKNGGKVWFIGPDKGKEFIISNGLDENSHPSEIILTDLEGEFGNWLRDKAKSLNIRVTEIEDISHAENLQPDHGFDDIILLNTSVEIVKAASQHLAFHGVLVLATNFQQAVYAPLDVGRIHYNRWLFIGGDNSDLSEIYERRPLHDSEIPAGSRVYFVGAGGPMGRMHVQRALEKDDKPSLILCSDVSEERLAQLKAAFEDDAKEYNVEFLCANPTKSESYQEQMRQFLDDGFDQIIILAPIPSLISENIKYLRTGGVMNIFAGIPRGNFSEIDLSEILKKDIRLIGHSASSIQDMKEVLKRVEDGKLSTNRSVVAIGSMEAVPEGLEAVKDARLPGKIVIYPHIRSLPLTALVDLENILPNVHAKLRNGKEWTNEAEDELLRSYLLER